MRQGMRRHVSQPRNWGERQGESAPILPHPSAIWMELVAALRQPLVFALLLLGVHRQVLAELRFQIFFRAAKRQMSGT